jgi:chemotaxis protein CheD
MKLVHVGIAELVISQDPDESLVAANLGSCIGVAAYDRERRVGGMVHCLLPLSKADPEKAAERPAMYVDTGVSLLLESLLARGVDRKSLVIVVAGGANINDEQNVFEIGKRNYTVVRKLLWKNNLLVRAEDVGESHGRTLTLRIADGGVQVRSNGSVREV